MCSGDHKIPCDPDSPLAAGRPTNGGGNPIPCFVVSCSRCEPVGGAGCALLGGLELKLSSTVFDIGFDRVKSFTRSNVKLI